MPNHYTTIAICSPGYEFNCDEFNERHKDNNGMRAVDSLMKQPEILEVLKRFAPKMDCEINVSSAERDFVWRILENPRDLENRFERALARKLIKNYELK